MFPSPHKIVSPQPIESTLDHGIIGDILTVLHQILDLYQAQRTQLSLITENFHNAMHDQCRRCPPAISKKAKHIKLLVKDQPHQTVARIPQKHNKNKCVMIVRMRIIAHLDMDAFFAAVEERNNPRFAGQPLAVGADPKGGAGRGIISTANYAARAYGLHSAMPITRAWRLSEAAREKGLPPVVFLTGSFRAYSAVSRNIMRIIEQFSARVQQRSIDEAYFDLSHAGSLAAARAIGQEIKQAIKKQEQLTASVGIGPNKLIAKIASDFNKPDGLTVVSAADAEAFLEPLSIRAIPGIGPRAEEKMRRLGIRRVVDMKKLSRQALRQLFGAWGDDLYEKIRGRDTAPLHLNPERAKSIGHNQTFFHDTLSPGFLLPRLIEACQHVHERLREDGFTKFRTVTITVRFHNFHTQTRSKTLPHATASLDILTHTALRLFLPFLDHRENPQSHPIRLVGVRLEKLS